MPYFEKCDVLSELARPFGFSYLFVQDVFIPRIEAWQKKFGYADFYDQAALSMDMVLDCESVYFNYQGKTWLIKFWKGQYGIHTGAEAGIYHADSIIPPALRPQTIFQAALPKEMLPMKLHLTENGNTLFDINKPHWWLAGFRTGLSTHPEDLNLEITIAFPDEDMCQAFVNALDRLGYKSSELLVCDNTVQFHFTEPKTVPEIIPDSWVQSYVLWKSKLFCRLYLRITRPFDITVDQLLYLYYSLPFVFRKTLRIRRQKRKRSVDL
ncbi:MAG: DUF4474 domain-containing protein [Muricomes sp.]